MGCRALAQENAWKQRVYASRMSGDDGPPVGGGSDKMGDTTRGSFDGSGLDVGTWGLGFGAKVAGEKCENCA